MCIRDRLQRVLNGYVQAEELINGVEQYVVPPFYDSLLAKLIVSAETREQALQRMRRALGEFVVEGPRTNLDFHRRLIDHPDFISGKLDTHFLEHFLSERGSPG